MIFIHQCVDEANFDKTLEEKSATEACGILEKCIEGNEKLKKVRLQTIRCQFELVQMESSEIVAQQFFNRIINHTNAMKACGEKISE